MEYYQDNWHLDAKPEKKLRVVIVGAGIAGLVAGIGECTRIPFRLISC